MDRKLVFATLGIAETKDEKIIKDAYRRKLTVTNPEDHPGEFKLLREAYERALAYMNESDTEGDKERQEDNSPAGQWMQRAEALYRSLSARQDKSRWQQLLADDVCLDLDYGEEIKWRLFSYLADHYQLRADIWRLLDEEFHIVNEQDRFKEHLPVAFVEFIVGRIADTEGAQDFPYEWFGGADDADYDSFQAQLYELEEYASQGQTAQAEPLITVMEQSGIDHPYFQVAKAQVCLQKGDGQQAEQIAEGLMSEQKYQNNLKIQALAAETLYKCGRVDVAEAGFHRITENFGRVYMIEKYLTFIERDKGNIPDAIDHCLYALRYYADDEELENTLRELDHTYIGSLEDGLKNGALDGKEADGVLRSLVRSGRAEEGIRFFEEYPEYMEKLPEAHQLLAMLYHKAERYDECIREAEIWRNGYMERLSACTEKTGPEADGGEISPELSDIYTNLERANSYIGSAYLSMIQEIETKDQRKALEQYRTEGVDDRLPLDKTMSEDYTDEFDRTTPDSVREEEKRIRLVDGLYEKAKDAYKNAAVYAPDDLNLHQQILEISFFQERYEEAIAKADELIERDAQWFPAYFRKQQACYELGRYQEVVDLFYQAKEIYAGFEQIYRLAFHVFNIYRQYGDAKNILRQAKEAGLTDGMTEVMELDLERRETREQAGAGKEIGLFEVYKKAIALLERFLKDENISRAVIAELYYELALLETDQPYVPFRHPGKETEYVKKAMALNHFAHDYVYLAAYIFHGKKRYDAAIRMYDLFLLHYPHNADALMNKGVCHESLGAWKVALDSYQKLRGYNPKHPDVNAYIARIYRDRFQDEGKIEYGELSVEYWNAQIENKPNDVQAYLDRGLQLVNLNRFEEALSDAEKIWELDRKNPYGWNLKGKALMYQGKYQQAIFHFKKAMEYMNKPAANGRFIYEYIAFCYWRSLKYDEAEKWYRREIEEVKAVDKTQAPFNAYDGLRRLYRSLGRYDEGVALVREAYERGVYSERKYRYYDLDMRTIPFLEDGRLAELLRDAEEIANHYNEIDDREVLAMLLLYAGGDVKGAVRATDRAIGEIRGKTCKDWDDRMDSLMVYAYAGEKQKALKLAGIIRNSMMRQYKTATEREAVEEYISSPGYGRVRMCIIITYYICSDQLETAAEYVRRLGEIPLCRDCKYCNGCFETFNALGMYYEALGETEKALEYYRKSYDVNKDLNVAMYKLRENETGGEHGIYI